MRREYQRRRDYVVDALNAIDGVTCPVGYTECGSLQFDFFRRDPCTAYRNKLPTFATVTF
jgi:hypothetical protein